jgi:predicted RNA methylase
LVAPSSPPNRRRNGLRELANSPSHLGAVVVAMRYLAKRIPLLDPVSTAFAARMKRHTDRENQRFDERFGTDSFTRLDLAALGLEEKTGYDFDGWGTCPVNESFFHEMMRAIPADLAGFDFIDVGAGKGKAMMLATEYPFRRVIGVELAEDLVSIARGNLARHGALRPPRAPVELHCQDFMRWTLPLEPSVLFFNDPFPASIAELAILHVEASLDACRRPAFVIYRKAELAVIDRLDRSPALRMVRGSPFWRIYASRT